MIHNSIRYQMAPKLALVLVSILMVFVIGARAETESNDNCSIANVILAPGVQSGSDIGSCDKKDVDYYAFNTDLNGTLDVTITNTGVYDLEYSALTTGCPASTVGTLAPGSSITLSVPSTVAGIYYVYMTGGATAVGDTSSYNISGLFTPNALASGTDLKITMSDSVDPVLIYDPYYYKIDVSNIGDQNASNVEVNDTLPSGVTVDLNMTNTLSPGWTCSSSTIGTTTTVNCGLTSDLLTGATSTLYLYVKAPSTGGVDSIDLTNTAVVGSDATDVDPSNNTASETTTITAVVDSADGLCYTDTTTMPQPQCDQKGNFYYGKNCDATVNISERNITDNITKVTVYKMYAPDTSNGSCTYDATAVPTLSTAGSCANITNTLDFGAYTEGYSVTLTWASVYNTLSLNMYDSSTYTNPRVDGVAMFGDYWTDSGFHHKGRIYSCSGISEWGIEIASHLDIIDTPIGTDPVLAARYNNSADTSDSGTNIKYIQTMIAGDTSRQITAVHLDLNDTATPYEYNGSVTGTIPYSAIPYITDGSCSTSSAKNIIDPGTGQQLVIDIPSGSYSATGTMEVPAGVSKDARMSVISVDPNTLSVEGQNCLANSSTTGNFARLAQCVNSEVQYKTAFGQDAWDRCANGNGEPCLSKNGGYSDPTSPTYNPLYNNELGCYMCTFDIQPSCTKDNFAIRPEKFDVNLTSGTVLISGKPIGLDFIATEYNTTSTGATDYNETEASSFLVDANITDASKVCPQKNVTHTPLVEFINGIDNDTFTFHNIGELNVTVHEINGSEYALVDADDTPDSGRLITEKEVPITIIPDHYEIDANLTNYGNGFTYMFDMNRFDGNTSTNEYNLSTASLDLLIKAVGEDGVITTNYIDSCYADPDINVTLNLSSPTQVLPVNSLTQFLYHYYAEGNGSTTTWDGNTTLPQNTPINELPIKNTTAMFPANALPDGNGTAFVQYKLNFNRSVTKPADPIQLALTDVEANNTKTSPYNVTGSQTKNDTVTFIYGRAHAPRYRVDCPSPTAQCTTPNPLFIYYEFYSDDQTSNVLTVRQSLAGDAERSKDSFNWFQNVTHIPSHDGNVSGLTAQKYDSNIQQAAGGIGTNGARSTINYTYNNNLGYPYKGTIGIGQGENNTSEISKWLIYNRFDTSAGGFTFEVEFNSKGSDALMTQSVETDDNASVNTSRRIQW